MNFKFTKGLILTAALFVAFACDEDEETSLTMSSSPSFTIDPFYKYGDSFDVTPTQIEIDDVEVGYYWKVSDLMSASDTSEFADGRFSYTFDKDTLGLFTVTCTAFAKGYYTSSGYYYVTLIKAGLNKGSIQGVGFKFDDYSFTDDRENQPEGAQQYVVTTYGDLVWMKQNLAYTTTDKQYGMAYQDCEATGVVMGRYYSWEEAQTVCPDGWRLPSEADFQNAAELASGKTLVKEEDWKDVNGAFMVYATFNDDTLWEYWPKVKVSNETGFSALSFGWCNLGDATFSGATKSAAYWTSDEYDSEQGVYRYIVDDKEYFFRGHGSKKYFGANVRCVKDK